MHRPPSAPEQPRDHEQLLEALQRDGAMRISDLSEALGAAPVTIRRDIAQLAAEGLVRRVHGGVALITPDEAPAADELPAGPDSLSGRTIGMLVPSLDYYWPDVARRAEEAALELDMRVVLRGSSYETEDDKPQLERLVDRMAVDGLIIAPRMDVPTAERTIDWLAHAGVPVVLVERAAPGDRDDGAARTRRRGGDRPGPALRGAAPVRPR
ncbi:DeoR family transcriptional regulator [Phytohabitans kaempferiae]|uniref:DeoR family transcriptional regulator n=1 Tax=Phytohabitans kaempferiae TaxID=1620943 RepID=A0ABV6MCX9_9ACTN